MKNRITKRLETGEAYFEGHNGRSSSDIKGRIFGEAADRLAWIEDKIAEGKFDEIKSLYFPDNTIKLVETVNASPAKTIYTIQMEDGYFVDVMHSTEDGLDLVYVLAFADGKTVFNKEGTHVNFEINEQKYVDFVRNIINNEEKEVK